MPGDSAAAALTTSSPSDLAQAAEAAIATARTGVEAVKAGGLPALELLDAYDEAMAALANAGRPGGPDRGEPSGRGDAGRGRRGQAGHGEGAAPTSRSTAGSTTCSPRWTCPARTRPTRHYLATTLRDFRRAGVDRDDATRARVRELQEELVGIGQDFDRNIRSDTRTAQLRPAGARAACPEDYVRAHPAGEDGLVRITTEYPDYVPFQTYADRRGRPRAAVAAVPAARATRPTSTCCAA